MKNNRASVFGRYSALMLERLTQLIYWIANAFAAVGAIGALFWLINGMLYDGDEVAFIIAGIFGVSALLSYSIGQTVQEGGFLRQRLRDVGLWLSDLVDRYRFRDKKQQ